MEEEVKWISQRGASTYTPRLPTTCSSLEREMKMISHTTFDEKEEEEEEEKKKKEEKEKEEEEKEEETHP